MYPNIEAMALEIAYDNGGIFNGMGICESRYESDVIADLHEFLANTDKTEIELARYDAWLGSLTKEQFETVSSGEETEMQAIFKDGPDGMDDFLNEIFEHCA